MYQTTAVRKKLSASTMQPLVHIQLQGKDEK